VRQDLVDPVENLLAADGSDPQSPERIAIHRASVVEGPADVRTRFLIISSGLPNADYRALLMEPPSTLATG